MNRSSASHPWWFWLLMLLAAGGFVMTMLVLVAGVWVFVVLGPRQTDDGVCTERLGVECEQVTPEAIERAARMTLPPGTVIESSHYQAFQDWRLEAVFNVPSDQIRSWEESLDAYPAPAAEWCTELSGRGADRVCASAGSPEDQPWREYTRVTQPDGSIIVHVEAFTT